jgi:two-component system sensor histidine kinase KdpD
MNRKNKKRIIDITLTVLILAASFGISLLFQRFEVSEQITTLFAFSVFLISLTTDGYLYGVISAIASVFIINYTFTYPYFNMDFSASSSIISAIIMLIIAVLTSAFTTRMKEWQRVKTESEKERMRANLLRAVSHDLRTPLTTIYGASSSIIENYDKLNDKQKLQMASGIKEDSEWLIRMVENLLSITRIDSGSVQLIKTPTVLDELIDSVILKFKKRYPEQRVELDIPNDVVIISMDAILIEQVIINILENAIHHAEGFTRLSLHVFTIENKAIFEITDNGCGIPSEKLDRIFMGYSDKAENASDTQPRNAGIGLSVCATIVKAHGGDITAENAKGGGAVFRFSLTTEDALDEQKQI